MTMPARSLVARAAWLPLLAVLALPAAAVAQMAPAQMAPVMRVDQTPSYTVELTIGPAEQMLSPAEAMTAKSGEVMVGGGPMAIAPSNSMGMAAPATTDSTMMMMTPTMDQGMLVNHHLEAHITRNTTGAVVNDVTPTFRVTDKATGESRDLPQVMAMYGVQMGPADYHYGQNVWLPDGTYIVTVMIGPDRVVFRDLTVTGSAPMSMAGG
jgi:hypothetical protein